MFHGLGQDIFCIKCLVVSDFVDAKRSANSGSMWIAFKWCLNLGVSNNAIYGKIVRSFKSFEQCICVIHYGLSQLIQQYNYKIYGLITFLNLHSAINKSLILMI